MDFRFTDEQQMWHETVHAFMEREVGIEYIRKHDEAREFPNEAYSKMAERGWLGLLIPEQYGGLEADPVMYAIFCEAIAKYSLDFAAAIMTSMFTATNIAFHGTDEQRRKYLPGFMEGRTKFSISITAPAPSGTATRGS
jgi:alkylation response protein AidB-like acyl-CoA dehydrogenase